MLTIGNCLFVLIFTRNAILYFTKTTKNTDQLVLNTSQFKCFWQKKNWNSSFIFSRNNSGSNEDVHRRFRQKHSGITSNIIENAAKTNTHVVDKRLFLFEFLATCGNLEAHYLSQLDVHCGKQVCKKWKSAACRWVGRADRFLPNARWHFWITANIPEGGLFFRVGGYQLRFINFVGI